MTNQQIDPSQRLVSEKAVLRIVPASQPTLRRWIKAGLFPAPLKLHHMIAFRETEVMDWINNRPRALKA